MFIEISFQRAIFSNRAPRSYLFERTVHVEYRREFLRQNQNNVHRERKVILISDKKKNLVLFFNYRMGPRIYVISKILLRRRIRVVERKKIAEKERLRLSGACSNFSKFAS